MTFSLFNEFTSREIFEQFLFEMDMRIESLQEVAKSHGLVLDLSVDSLDDLEILLKQITNTPQPMIDSDSLIVLSGRYLGEVLRTSFGGEWHLSVSNPKDINFNQPVILGHNNIDVAFAPISLARAFAKKQTLGLFKRAIMSQISPAKLDLSVLANKENKKNA